MENLVKIAEGVLTSCLAVKPGEEILVITDDSRKEIGEAIYEAAGNLGCEKILMVMKEREVSGQEPPKAIAEAMKAADVVIAPTAQSLTHTNARIEAAKAGTRVATMPGITKEMFSQCSPTPPRHASKKMGRFLRSISMAGMVFQVLEYIKNPENVEIFLPEKPILLR